MKSVLAVGFSLFFLVVLLLWAASPSERAVEVRNQGYAELENEKPADAENSFRQLAKLAPEDPLPHANLAIALLRQQKNEEALAAIRQAEAKSPNDPRLIAIRGEIQSWSGETQKALDAFREAARLAPQDQETQYTLYRVATTTGGDGAAEAAAEALERLARLRPENLVVLLQLGKSAREHSDRATATAAYLRIRDLIWQAPRGADRLLEEVLGKLEENEFDGLRVPALRLENVLKVTPMYKESLRELQTGIQGVPLESLREEPAVRTFGAPAEVRLTGRSLVPAAGMNVRLADLDGDARPEIIRLIGESLADRRLVVLKQDGTTVSSTATAGSRDLLVLDLDNDGHQDVFAFGPEAAHLLANDGSGGLADRTDAFGLRRAAGRAAVAFDFDIEGDLDLLVAANGQGELFRNNLGGALDAVGGLSLPDLILDHPCDAIASDFDRDGDLDVLIMGRQKSTRLDNLRQGRFKRLEESFSTAGASRILSADFDNDGWPDLVAAGNGVRFWRNKEGKLESWDLGSSLGTSAHFSGLAVLDADNDGLLDVAVAGDGGIAVLAQRSGGFDFLPIDNGPSKATAVAAADLDGDGDVDLVSDGPEGLHLLDNQGGNKNGWLAVRLKGLDKGNSKNNIFGLGATLEIRAGSAYQFREVTSETTHFGLGQIESPDLLRAVWTNGVPQNRFDPTPDQWIVEEQVLKGSCPFVYSWNGSKFAFETDLLWGAPAGLPVAAGVWAGADAEELVRLDLLKPDDGLYRLRITEELWEAAFFDYSRLWVVDHPAETEAASTLKIVPGSRIEDRVVASRGLQSVVAAWDATGQDVTDRVRHRDEIYADGWTESAYQGVASEPWTFTFDLGTAPRSPVRLHLDGWIFPADASLNLAIDQRPGLASQAPRLEMLTSAGWTNLIQNMGHPAGKTKTMVVDTPPLPEGARKLRIVSNQWLSWDRIAWTADRADGSVRIAARLEPTEAELRFRGFSAPLRRAPNAPHVFDYSKVTQASPWLAFPGSYTRFGDVRELLMQSDSRSVVLGAGDEIVLTFDGSHLPAVAQGMRRTLFLESHGWDKDADRNTFAAAQVEPLPFRGMSGYPYGPDESFPETPAHRRYLAEYQTRKVE